jgi:hypothetical protein
LSVVLAREALEKSEVFGKNFLDMEIIRALLVYSVFDRFRTTSCDLRDLDVVGGLGLRFDLFPAFHYSCSRLWNKLNNLLIRKQMNKQKIYYV